MATLTKAKHLSLVEDVTRQLEEAILDGAYRPGDKLPSTRELMEIFGASLGTIRESLAVIEQLGLLEVRKGAKGGFFVQEITNQPIRKSLEILMRHRSLTTRELYEFRATLEAGVIRLVVQRANDEQVQLFMSYLDKFKACLNDGQAGWLRLVEIEQDLRIEFMKVIQNRTYEAVLVPINDGLLEYAANNLPGGHKEAQDAYDYWVKIMAAVADRDENRSADLIKQLLFHFKNLILKAAVNTKQPD